MLSKRGIRDINMILSWYLYLKFRSFICFLKSCKVDQLLYWFKFFTKYWHCPFNNVSRIHWSDWLHGKYKSVFHLSHFYIVLQSFHANGLSFLWALSTKYTLFGGDGLQDSIVYLEDFSRARISDGLFLG